MKEGNTRIKLFDVAKGISILLMTIGRYDFGSIYYYLSEFQKITSVLRMPTFIFISGYLISDRLRFRYFLYTKIDGLLKPLFSFTISLTILHIIFYIITSDAVSVRVAAGHIVNLARYYYQGNFNAVNVSFWFIASLFLGQISLKGFLEIKKLKTPLNYVLMIAFIVVLALLNTHRIDFYWTQYIPIFFTYLLIGYCIKTILTDYFQGNSFFYSKIMVLFPIAFFSLFVYLYQSNIKLEFGLGSFNYNYHYLLLLSLLGIFTIIYICRYLEKIPIVTSVLVYCSKASFFILAFHIFIKQAQAVFFDLKTYNPFLHTALYVANIAICCIVYELLKKVPYVRLMFYPLKALAVNAAEIKLLKSRYVKRFLSREIYSDVIAKRSGIRKK